MPTRPESRVEPKRERRIVSGAEETSEKLTLDEAFKILRNSRRRAILRYLRTNPETTLSELADQVAAEETEVPPSHVDPNARKRVYISLYQSHLPALVEAGVIAYDGDGGEIRRLPTADQLDRHLEQLDTGTADFRERWGRYLVAGVGLVVVAGAAGLPPLNVVSPVVWTGIGVLVLCTLTVTTIQQTS